jgi:hypothetical protein
MLYEVSGDLVRDKKYQVFCHQTNCKGVMGAGIALQIKLSYPEVSIQNKAYCDTQKEDSNKLLGTNLYVRTSDGRTCVNIYAQDHYRNDGTRKTDYTAFKSCLIRLMNKLSVSDPDIKVGFPYGIGCGLGGGDWEIIRGLLQSFSDSVKQDVYIVKLDK